MGLDHAMKDVAHRAMPRASPNFVNHLQRSSLAQGLPLEHVPPEPMQAVFADVSAVPLVYDDDVRAEAARYGAIALLQKPIRGEELVWNVRRAMRAT